MQRRTFLLDGGRAALGFGAFWLSGCASPAPSPAKDPFLQSLITPWEAGIPQWLRETRMPAVSIAIVRHGRLAWQRAFGVKDTGTGEPVDTDTVFAACSNTKPVFAYGVLKLCEKGVLSLDTPLTKYTKRRITKDPRLDLITTRHVLNHTAGFPNWRWMAKGWQQGMDIPIEFDPGSKFEYSGEGFSYLQSVVMELTGQSFEAFMEDSVLRPLGMTSSRISSDADYKKRMATPHDESGKPHPGQDKVRSEAERTEDMATYGAAAALSTTPTDYAKFLLAFIEPPPADHFRLNDASRQDMLRPQVKKTDTTWEGLAWALERHDGGPMLFTHAGQADGWYCFCAASTERRSGLMVMLNGDAYVPFLTKMLTDPSLPARPLERLWPDFAIRFFAG